MQYFGRRFPVWCIGPLAMICVCSACNCGIASAADIANNMPPPSKIADTTEPLVGTLFFSREQREKIDRARLRGVRIDEKSVLFLDGRPVINGFVKRSDGFTTVWVDGQPLSKVTLATSNMVEPSDVGGGRNETRIHLDGAGAVTPKRMSGPKKSPTYPRRNANFKW